MEYIRLKDVDFKGNMNKRVFVQFISRDVDVRLQKDKVTKFITFNMVDKGKSVDAKIFGAKQEQIELVTNNKVFNAAVDVKPYDRAPEGYSCIIYNIEEGESPPEMFADWHENLQESKEIIEKALGDVINTLYGQIAYPIVIGYWDKISKWSAAKGQHHEKLGGLLTHTAEVLRISNELADLFNGMYGEGFINRGLLISSAILHDIGKVKELDVDVISGHVEYSTRAALSTHIIDIMADVDIQANKMGLGVQKYEVNEINQEEPEKTQEELADETEALLLLKHCLAAHHGKLEWGSPITDSVPEAYILHTSDMLSAEMYKYNRSFSDLCGGDRSASWNGSCVKKVYKDSSKY